MPHMYGKRASSQPVKTDVDIRYTGSLISVYSNYRIDLVANNRD